MCWIWQRAHLLTLEALAQGNRIYNLGNGEGFSVRQVIDAARAVTGAPIPEQVGARRAGGPGPIGRIERADSTGAWLGAAVSGSRADYCQCLALAPNDTLPAYPD